MTSPSLYAQHLDALDAMLSDSLARAQRGGIPLEAVLFHAGRVRYYHADDCAIPFRATPHFLRYAPLLGPEHVVLARPGRRPLVIRVVPQDYWEEIAPLAPSYWQSAVDLHEVSSPAEVPRLLGSLEHVAYVGGAPEAAAEWGITPERVEPKGLMHPLDWHRAFKTAHEVALTEVACQHAAEGHRVARKAFEAGASEREIHWAYLAAANMLEGSMQYETIVCLDEKSAVLHYHHKRGRLPARARNFLLDAGATCDGYGADITRTWATSEADPTWREMIDQLDAVQRDLVAMLVPGALFTDVQRATHRGVASVLIRAGVLRCSVDEAYEKKLTHAFFPHGIGHHLGLQVHDVGGKQTSPDGGQTNAPADDPYLRTTRPLAAGHLLTVEPGLYFVPMLLSPLREGPQAGLIDWKVVDRLMPLGGIRIEDNVLVTPVGPKDLTRPLLAGTRGT